MKIKKGFYNDTYLRLWLPEHDEPIRQLKVLAILKAVRRPEIIAIHNAGKGLKPGQRNGGMQEEEGTSNDWSIPKKASLRKKSAD